MPHAYLFDFDTVNCSCEDFKKQKQICKHFCGGFLLLLDFSYDRLPKEYRENLQHNLFMDFQLANNIPEDTGTTYEQWD